MCVVVVVRKTDALAPPLPFSTHSPGFIRGGDRFLLSYVTFRSLSGSFLQPVGRGGQCVDWTTPPLFVHSCPLDFVCLHPFSVHLWIFFPPFPYTSQDVFPIPGRSFSLINVNFFFFFALELLLVTPTLTASLCLLDHQDPNNFWVHGYVGWLVTLMCVFFFFLCVCVLATSSMWEYLSCSAYKNVCNSSEVCCALYHSLIPKFCNFAQKIKRGKR